jgi:hypothetical protein
MTPFDPWALLAMLLAFYPTPSAAALRQARAERPEYFAGGTIIGSKGDKLQLPDARVFDLIFAAGGLPGDQRWQVIDVTGDAGGDEWPLEPGPLTPIDPSTFPASGGDSALETLWGETWAALGNPDAGIGRALTEIGSIADATPMVNSYYADVGAAAGAVDDQLASLHVLDPADLIDATQGEAYTIDGAREEIVNPADEPDDVNAPDPGVPPHEEPPSPGPPGGPGPNIP